MSYIIHARVNDAWRTLVAEATITALEIEDSNDPIHYRKPVWTAPAPKKRVHPQRFTVTDHVAMAFEREDGGVDVYRYPVSGAGPDAWAEVRFPATYA